MRGDDVWHAELLRCPRGKVLGFFPEAVNVDDVARGDGSIGFIRQIGVTRKLSLRGADVDGLYAFGAERVGCIALLDRPRLTSGKRSGCSIDSTAKSTSNSGQ